MKIRFVFSLFIVLSIFGCDNTKKEKPQDKSQSESITKEVEKYIVEGNSFNYRPYRYKEILDDKNDPNRTRRNLERYNVYGDFNVDKNIINVSIPVTSDKLDIVDVINISHRKANAILILLDGNEGLPTNTKPITSVIHTEIDISELKLNRGRLNNHKKIRVIVYHNDTFNSKHYEYYKRCIKHHKYDKEKKCSEISEIAALLEKDVKPGEDGGDIIP